MPYRAEQRSPKRRIAIPGDISRRVVIDTNSRDIVNLLRGKIIPRWYRCFVSRSLAVIPVLSDAAVAPSRNRIIAKSDAARWKRGRATGSNLTREYISRSPVKTFKAVSHGCRAERNSVGTRSNSRGTPDHGFLATCEWGARKTEHEFKLISLKYEISLREMLKCSSRFSFRSNCSSVCKIEIFS